MSARETGVAPDKVETWYDPVLGLLRFPPGGVAAWLADEVDPESEMSELEIFFYDPYDYPAEVVRDVLDAARGRGMGIEIDGDEVRLWGCPGDGANASDDAPLAAACLRAAAHGGRGVVMFLGTRDREGADFALALDGRVADVRRIAAQMDPPALPVAARELLDTLGATFDARDEVGDALENAGFEVERG